ncbi:DUF1254 domain-containing protein [uncultured Desulfosarcina sp.]|uniref:DUF1254 domain-containing protein n=1 Tax=uncultured Desulfosarcina sp. TaxID=218289 RepID=UPI0029C800CC|nr:DUF1254 domain-containing protein [uncultured Desulfosarcina sp.]
MNAFKKMSKSFLAACMVTLFLAGAVIADDIPKGYNTPIPPSIMTPDKVKTSIGTLNFFDGVPTEKTAQMALDHLTFLRGVEAFLNGVPMASIHALVEGYKSIGVTEANHMIVTDKLMDSNPLFLTANTDTVYAFSFFDLEKTGPLVIEVPPGTGPGTVNDAYFRFVVDMGAPGPDRGKGGKYLILPPDYEGEAPKGYFVAKSPSYINLFVLRGFLVDGKPDSAAKMFSEQVHVYPLSQKDNPPKMVITSGSGISYNTIHANDFTFYEEINDVLQKEPIDFIDPELRGLFASIGLQKGKAFKPTPELKKILTDAVAVANATARALIFHTPQKEAYLYENSYWKVAFIGGNHEWLKDKGEGGRYLDARTLFFYGATVNTPAMVMQMVGVGSQYAMATQDSKGNVLDGSKTYKLNIPANVPAKDFWSVVIYDPQTRSELQTSTPFPSKNSEADKMTTNSDGSIDLYFGPEAPKGKENNWIETVSNKSWFPVLRLYGPLEPWFEKTWRPGEIELVK